jgi:hypothetical protein
MRSWVKVVCGGAVLLVIAGVAAAEQFAKPPEGGKVATTAATTSSSQPADDLAKWRETVDRSENERRALGSIQFDMDVSVTYGPHAKPAMTLDYVLTYAAQGQSFYAKQLGKGDQRQAVPEVRAPAGKFDVAEELAFDGAIAQLRQSAQQKLRSQAHKPETLSSMPVLPWNVISFLPAVSLENLMTQGRILVASVKDETDRQFRLRTVTMNYAQSGRPFFQITYDMARGWLPVKAQEFMEDGALAGEVRGVTIQECTSEGRVYYVPVAGTMETFDRGQSSSCTSFRVNAKTLVVGQRLPQSVFQLRPKKGETVYDSDRQQFVTDSLDGPAPEAATRPAATAAPRVGEISPATPPPKGTVP